jgi:hypothetical protein
LRFASRSLALPLNCTTPQTIDFWHNKMDQARRERLREIIRFLEITHSEVHEISLDEEAAFDSGHVPSNDTQSDQISSEAIDSLSEAADDIESAITNLHDAIGDKSSRRWARWPRRPFEVGASV